MMFYTKNLTSQELFTGNPWDFVPTEALTARIRRDKEDRQAFYGNPATSHHFYSGIEPMNPKLRISKDNPPFKIHALAADYDVRIPDETVTKAIEAMRVKPAWIERSLGGNIRLVWTLEQPLLVDDTSFCSFVLAEAAKWLKLELLPALDLAAFTTTSRLLCNGCDWKATGHPEISLKELQSFFVACSKDYRFKGTNEVVIPFDLLEKACKEKFPNMNWPGVFEPGAQGPTFWIPESVSPMSAIIKDTGIVTFSAHATKVFYTWADILGADFVREFTQSSVSKATADIWWDSKRYWRKIGGYYCSLGKDELMLYLKVDCKMSGKADKSGSSPIESALHHVNTQNRIKAAVPYVFRPSGLLVYKGNRTLNTYMGKPTPPAAGTQKWGPHGEFPFLSAWQDVFYFPVIQLVHFNSWLHLYYTAAFNEMPLPGQNIFTLGHVAVGKTFQSRELVGTLVGGFVDASDYLINGGQFNSHLLHVPHWCLDDDSPGNSPQAQMKFQAAYKKLAANQDFNFSQKFEVSFPTAWAGRAICTTNMDFVSTRILGPMDDSSLDKTHLFRCADEPFNFPGRLEQAKLIAKELPYYARWILDYQPPDYILPCSRFGYKSYQEPTILDRAHQTSPAAPFKELLIDTLHNWFTLNPEEKSWKGTVSQLVKLMASDPLNESIMRSMRLDGVSRYLEQILRTGDFKCTTSTGAHNTRIWEFPRLEGFKPITPHSSPTAVSFEMPATVEQFV